VDGSGIADKLLRSAEFRGDVDRLSDAGVTPTLVAVLVGDVAESKIYVERKKAAADRVGVRCRVQQVPADVSQEKLVSFQGFVND
jgi:methylenetetrahydrofolate dehydrogenase (NADP+)/methenyltetrahydrofolate cyclohydrolase